MKLHINITRNDIKNGVCFDSKACAVANAMKKIVRKGYVVGIDGVGFRITTASYPDETISRGLLSGTLRNFVFEFDAKKSVKPLKTAIKISKKNAQYFKSSALEA